MFLSVLLFQKAPKPGGGHGAGLWPYYGLKKLLNENKIRAFWIAVGKVPGGTALPRPVCEL